MERGREDAVVCGRENHTTSRRWFWCAFVGNRGMSSGGTQMVRDGPLGRCGRTARPFSGSGVKLSGTFWELSSQNRVYPAEMWQSSGGGRRWPIRRRPGGVANTEIERYPILATGLILTYYSSRSPSILWHNEVCCPCIAQETHAATHKDPGRHEPSLDIPIRMSCGSGLYPGHS